MIYSIYRTATDHRYYRLRSYTGFPQIRSWVFFKFHTTPGDFKYLAPGTITH